MEAPRRLQITPESFKYVVIIGVNKLLSRQAREFLGSESVHAARLRVDFYDVPVHIRKDQAVGGRIEDTAITLFTLPESLLGAHAVGNIAIDPHVAAGSTCLVAHGEGRKVQDAGLAAFRDCGDLAPAKPFALEVIEDALKGLGLHVNGRRFAFELGGGVAEEAGMSRILREVKTVRIKDCDAVEAVTVNLLIEAQPLLRPLALFLQRECPCQRGNDVNIRGGEVPFRCVHDTERAYDLAADKNGSAQIRFEPVLADHGIRFEEGSARQISDGDRLAVALDRCLVTDMSLRLVVILEV